MQEVFEKIIEKLEEEKMSYFLTIANTGDEKLDCAYEQVGDALDKAIEIVKQGSVDDDVCEWKLKDACYTSSIKHYDALPTSIVKTFTNCPYCGKKIKVVGD